MALKVIWNNSSCIHDIMREFSLYIYTSVFKLVKSWILNSWEIRAFKKLKLKKFKQWNLQRRKVMLKKGSASKVTIDNNDNNIESSNDEDSSKWPQLMLSGHLSPKIQVQFFQILECVYTYNFTLNIFIKSSRFESYHKWRTTENGQ